MMAAMLPSTIDRIDGYWAERLGCRIDDLREPRVTLVTHHEALAEYRGVYALRSHDGGLLVSSPASHAGTLRDAIAGLPPDRAFDAALLRGTLGDAGATVIGPASLAYADSAAFIPATHTDVRRLTPAEAGALDALRTRCDATEWAHSGIQPEHDPIFARFDDGNILAAASWAAMGPLRHIGVITHPEHRGHGYASAVGSAVTSAALTDGAVPQWQTLLSNAPSLAVGRRLGFVERYRSIAVRLV